MKRSRNEDQIATTATNDVTPATAAKGTGPTQKKRQKTCAVNCFEWLPEEMVQAILEQVSWKLDGVLRLVHSTWYKAMDRRWDPKARLVDPDKFKPCIDWALCHHHLSLLKWAVGDMKLVPPKRFDGDEASLMRHACLKGDINAIVWLAREICPAPAYMGICPIELSDDHVYAAAEGPSMACFGLVLQWSMLGFPNAECAYRACRGGRVDTMAYIMSTYVYKDGEEHNPNYPTHFIDCLVNACISGSIPMVDWVMIHGKREDAMVGVIAATSECIVGALRYGHVELAKHLIHRWKCPVKPMAVIRLAASGSNLEVMQCALDITPAKFGGNYDYLGLHYFIKHRHFDVLDRLVAKMNLNLDESFVAIIQDDTQSLAMLDWMWLHCDQECIRKYIGGKGPPIGHSITTQAMRFFKRIRKGDHQDVEEWLKAHDLADHLYYKY